MTPSLTYFDFDGSRGLECRLALTIAGVAFTDVRLSREQWVALKPSTPYGGLPVFEADGRRLAHSAAILGYVGRTHGLHPADAWAAAEHEAVMQSVEDLRYKLPDSKGKTPEELRTARETFASGWLTQWAATVAGRIAGPFLEGAQVHVADLKLYVMIRGIQRGTYDHIPGSFLDAWPALGALREAVDALPAVAEYWKGR